MKQRIGPYPYGSSRHACNHKLPFLKFLLNSLPCMRMEHIYQFQHWLFFIGLGMLLSLALYSDLKGNKDRRGITLNARSFISNYENRTVLSRKLLFSPDMGDGTNRIGQDCSKDDIVVFQGSTNPLPSGVPAYTVEIFNTCVSDCNIAEIHVSCGWFSSVRLVNPRVFRRLGYDDCLVNDGQPLGPGQTLSFQYANSFSYPLSVSSVSCKTQHMRTVLQFHQTNILDKYMKREKFRF